MADLLERVQGARGLHNACGQATRGQFVASRLIVVSGQRDLLQVVLALRAGGSLTHLLHGGQQQADEYRDDSDHDQQLDQRKPDAGTSSSRRRRLHDGSTRGMKESVWTGL